MRKSLLISGLAAVLLSPVASQAEPTQAAAALPPPGPFSTPPVADSSIHNILRPTARVNRQQLIEKMKQRWDARKAEHEQQWQTYKEEQELRRQEMQQRREQRANAHYRPLRPRVTVTPQHSQQPQQTTQPNTAPTAPTAASQPAPAVQNQMPPAMPYGMPRQRPSYGYPVPQTYGYGSYPTQPNNSGAPWGYPQRPPQSNWRRW